jgi:hypothetical protein
MPKKQYPAFYEKAIPIALAAIFLLVIVLLVVVVVVISGAG